MVREAQDAIPREMKLTAVDPDRLTLDQTFAGLRIRLTLQKN